MQQSETSPVCHKTILIVDNNSAIRQRLLKLLRSQGYHVNTARNAETALTALRASQPTIIVVGSTLPEIPAIDLYRRLNADKLPALFMLDPETISESALDFLAHCGAEFISRPFQDNELLLRLRISLRCQQREQQHQKRLAMLRESEKSFRSFAEHSLDTFIRFDRQYHHLYVNPIVEQQTGIPPEAFLGKPMQSSAFPNISSLNGSKRSKRPFGPSNRSGLNSNCPAGSGSIGCSSPSSRRTVT
jgi:CheY-like chemotaxis protein